MKIILLLCTCLYFSLVNSYRFVLAHRKQVTASARMFPDKLDSISFILSDTSVSEEEVLNVVGQTASLPDPIYLVGTAAFILIGVGILQFSLGDLTKEVFLIFQTVFFSLNICSPSIFRKVKLEFVTFCKQNEVLSENEDILINNCVDS